MAVLIALIGLCILSLIGLFMCLTSAVEVRISDNYESGIQAGFAARAGINHARELIRGLKYSDQLEGPDGFYDSSPAYLERARTFLFRNPLPWGVARTLDLADPGPALNALADDGVLNTGKCGAASGIALIPKIGIGQTAFGASVRYFVKITDNNGEASELAQDPQDNPFYDGDGIVIARAMGLAQTLAEPASGSLRRNSVAVVEARFKQNRVFDLVAPLEVSGSTVLPAGTSMFEGNLFLIEGGSDHPAIATIDTNVADGNAPAAIIRSQIGVGQVNRIRGQGGSPSVVEVSAAAGADPDKGHLLEASYLYSFAHTGAPGFADTVFQGPQLWTPSASAALGFFDLEKPANDPSQAPKVTWVDGDAEVIGNVSGAGILIVTGRLFGTGKLSFIGLILLIGSGEAGGGGLSFQVQGGIYVANVDGSSGTAVFGPPKITISGDSSILMNVAAIRMALRLLPPSQIGWREIRNGIDP
jgi:hypothetical protein